MQTFDDLVAVVEQDILTSEEENLHEFCNGFERIMGSWPIVTDSQPGRATPYTTDNDKFKVAGVWWSYVKDAWDDEWLELHLQGEPTYTVRRPADLEHTKLWTNKGRKLWAS